MAFFLFYTAIGFLVACVLASFFEWALHRYVMHRKLGKFTYPFERHTLIHHHIFKADQTYHLKHEQHKATIPMAWWNGPVLIALFELPFLAFALWSQKWGILCGAAIAVTAYYGMYEYLHWCMHFPKSRHVEKSGIFFRLNGHHLLHHRYMQKNYNVVLPLADLCLGTLILRSRVKFKQAEGPAVPNVQPRLQQAA